MFKLDSKKAEEPEIILPTSARSSKKQESSRKTSTSALLPMPKPLTVWITTNRGKFWKRWEYQTTWSASWEICLQVKKLQLELDMEQQTGSRSEKEYVKAVYCHPTYLTYMQSTSCKMPGCMNIDVTILEQANRTWQCNKSIVHMSSSEGGVPYLLCLKL